MKKKRGTWQKTRKFFNDIHLWTGLISGLVVFVVCFSGTIYTYNTELREWAVPHLHWVDVPVDKERFAADSLAARVADVADGTVTAMTIPADPARTYQVTIRTSGDESRFGTIYYVNPYTGEICGTSGEETKTSAVMSFLFSLHRWLLLDRVEEPLIDGLPNRQLGSYITGTATILFTLGVITGLFIWFPQKMRTWRQGLRIKWGGGWKRLNHDLHNTLAFYSLILLFLMGITGPQWSFPWYREGLQKTLGTYREAPTGNRGGPTGIGRRDGGPGGSEGRGGRGESRAEKAAATSLPMAQYVAAADEALPYRGDYRITLPVSGDSVLRVSKNRVGFFASAASDQLKIDVVTASVLDVSIFRDKPFNERIAGSIKALHVGNVYGQFTKLLYFLACLVATSLPVTGTLIWLNKMKKRPASRKRKIRELVAE